MALKLSGTVGDLRSQNNPSDVKLVQRLLIAHGQHRQTLQSIKINGICGTETIDGIKKFQHHRHIVPENGVVLPSDAPQSTWRQLTSHLHSTAGRLLNMKAQAQRLAGPDFEGFVDHIYLDSNGLTTVGIGMLLEQLEFENNLERTVDFVFSKKIELVSRSVPEQKAGREQVRQDIQSCWDRWDKSGGNLKSTAFAPPTTSLKINKAQAEALVEAHLVADLDTLRGRLIGFDRLPLPAREAMLDIQYNVRNFTPHVWQDFFLYVTVGDWLLAAKASHRKPPVSPKRNEWTYNQFVEASRELPAAGY